MPIEVLQVSSKSELDTFISLPNQIYSSFSNYVPPLDLEMRGILDPAKSPFFKYGEAVYWIAYKEGKPVGRISAQIDKDQTAPAYKDAGLFGCLDAVDDPEVTSELISVAENWLIDKGFRRALGPFMLNINGLAGLMVDGETLPPLTMTQWHPPYLEAHLDKLGYQQVRDLHYWGLKWVPDLEGEYSNNRRLPELPSDVSFRSLDFKNLDRDVEIIRRLFNEAWRENWGFTPLHLEDVETLRKELKPILTPEMGIIVEKNGNPVAAMLVIPNLYEISSDLGPRPSPIGWLRFAWRLLRHKYSSGRIFIFGMSDDVRHSVGGAVIAIWTVQKLVSLLLKMKQENGWIEAGWVLDNNKPLRAILKNQGFQITRTLRLFDRPIGCKKGEKRDRT